RELIPFWTRFPRFFRSVSLKELAVFSRQFATLLEAQVPIADSLRTLQKQTENKIFQEKISEISADVESGLAISAALSRHENIFSSFFISMVKSGEVSGNLEEILSYLSDYLEKQYDLNSKVKGALWYPIVVLFFFVVIAAAMIVLVIPQLELFLVEFGAELPWPTRFIIGAGQVARAGIWVFMVLAFFAALLFSRYIKTPEGRFFWDSFKIKLPIFGRLLKYIYVTHFSETLGTLLEGGIPINQALIVSGDVVNNQVYKNIILKAEESVRQGEATSRIIGAYPDEFPPIVSQMMAIGEKTGRLADLLKRVATFYRREVDKIVANLVVLIEPILIVGLGVMVGLLLAAVLLPIYQLVTTLSLSG
ncbi:MAG: type II secretion system F family protein, partial [bacterium]|nr:type II secretion system F family protein [bacterium]